MITTAITPARTNRSPVFEWWRSVDHITLAFLVSLIGTGIILSMAASPAAADRLHVQNPFYFMYRHIFFAALGMSGAFILSLASPSNARRIGVVALFGAIALMVLVASGGGVEVKGSTRWLRIGPFGLQPSEFAKPAFIVFAAWMFSVRKRDPNVPSVAIVFAAYLALIALLIQQPDFGQSFLLTLCFAAVFFFAGLSLGWMIILMGVTGVGAIVAYFSLDHVRDRVNRFLSPGDDSYQVDKALEAIGNGGFFGRGPGEGAVKFVLPDGHTDFIFAVTVEEFGFLISLFLVLLLAGFVIRCFRNALKLKDYFCQLAVAGLATMIGMQTIINLYVNLNMAPPKGMTLPFISYGGSSMLALCFTAGLILAFTRRRPGAYGYGD